MAFIGRHNFKYKEKQAAEEFPEAPLTNGYSIRRKCFSVEHGMVVEILGFDGHWYSQCDDCYKTILEAKDNLVRIRPDNRAIRAKHFIQGPNGGKHPAKVKV